MKKLIILITTLLSLNLFGGLVHKDVDTRFKEKIGYGFLEKDNRIIILGLDLTMKTDIFKDSNFNVYAGGKLNVQDDIVVTFDKTNAFNTSLIGIVGLEEKYMDFKFYQQLGLGFGYYLYSQNTLVLHGFNVIAPELEVGIVYKNIVFSLEGNLKLASLKVTGFIPVRIPEFTVSAGYEF